MTIKPNCECLQNIDENLEKQNLRIKSICITNFTTGELTYLPLLQTEKIDSSIRGTKTRTVVPSYCPFCGTKYLDNKGVET